ncbi:tripartite tricarboxylate transporter substrate-binding protein [Cupriavidus sp. PET2-C1]
MALKQAIPLGILEALRESPSNEASFQIIDSALQTMVGHKLLSVLRFHATDGSLERLYSSNIGAYPVGGRKDLALAPASQKVIESNHYFVANSADEVRRAYCDAGQIASIGCASVLNMPVRIQGRTLGTLNLLHEEHWFTPERIRVVDLASFLVAIPLLFSMCEAGGTIAATFARNQPSDGYTLFLGTVSTQSVAPFLYAKLPYDPVKDFTALTMIASVPNVVVLNKSIPATNLQQFTALATSKPGKLSYGSSGKGSSNHLATEGLISRLGLQVVHAPYKGSGPALIDTMAGHVDFMLDVVLTSLPYIKKGELKAIAVTSSKRIPVLPDVPTVAEQGFPGFEAIGWFGLFAPPALPDQLRKRISSELIAVIRSKEFGAHIESLGALPSGIEPGDFERVVAADRARWGQVAKAAGVVPE